MEKILFYIKYTNNYLGDWNIIFNSAYFCLTGSLDQKSQNEGNI